MHNWSWGFDDMLTKAYCLGTKSGTVGFSKVSVWLSCAWEATNSAVQTFGSALGSCLNRTELPFELRVLSKASASV